MQIVLLHELFDIVPLHRGSHREDPLRHQAADGDFVPHEVQGVAAEDVVDHLPLGEHAVGVTVPHLGTRRVVGRRPRFFFFLGAKRRMPTNALATKNIPIQAISLVTSSKAQGAGGGVPSTSALGAVASTDVAVVSCCADEPSD